jgi:hypothetical protein
MKAIGSSTSYAVIMVFAYFSVQPSAMSQNLDQWSRNDLIEYCGGLKKIDTIRQFDNSNDPVCICIADSVDFEKYPELPKHVTLTLDGMFALTEKEQMLISVLKSRCERDPEVLERSKIRQKQFESAAILEFCKLAEAEGMLGDCDCFLSIVEGDLDDRLAYSIKTGGLNFLIQPGSNIEERGALFIDDAQMNTLKHGMRECR